jgi:hypothetical protein
MFLIYSDKKADRDNKDNIWQLVRGTGDHVKKPA